jgi:hypothetical protein
MYNHPSMLQRARRRSEDEQSSLANTKGEIYARSPTQASFHPSPGGRSHSKPSTPLPPNPHAYNNGALHHSPPSPHAALPPIASAVAHPHRETPSTYYDPTQDTGDRALSRGQPARYEPYAHEVCLFPSVTAAHLHPIPPLLMLPIPGNFLTDETYTAS